MKITLKIIAILVGVLIVGAVIYYFDGGKTTSTDFTTPAVISTDISTTTVTDPVITSISPTSGPVGTVVELRGKNLSGFEGDLVATFEQANGKEYVLTDNFGDYPKTGASLIKVTVKEPCQKGETVYAEYSGKSYPCDYDPMIPGVYKVYTEPWGKKSNTVTFTIL